MLRNTLFCIADHCLHRRVVDPCCYPWMLFLNTELECCIPFPCSFIMQKMVAVSFKYPPKIWSHGLTFQNNPLKGKTQPRFFFSFKLCLLVASNKSKMKGKKTQNRLSLTGYGFGMTTQSFLQVLRLRPAQILFNQRSECEQTIRTSVWQTNMMFWTKTTKTSKVKL